MLSCFQAKLVSCLHVMVSCRNINSTGTFRVSRRYKATKYIILIFIITITLCKNDCYFPKDISFNKNLCSFVSTVSIRLCLFKSVCKTSWSLGCSLHCLPVTATNNVPVRNPTSIIFHWPEIFLHLVDHCQLLQSNQYIFTIIQAYAKGVY